MMNNIPDYITNLIKENYPKDYEEILEGYNKKRYTTFRYNSLKDYSVAKKELQNLKLKPFLYEDAFLLEEEYDLASTKAFIDGLIYLQSLSSMVPPLILNPKEKETILDMTAAPGSKSSMIQALTKNSSSLTAVELDKVRYERLKYNLNKLGVKNVSVLNQNALKLDEFFSFDKILLDAPCSGSGTLNVFDHNMEKFSLKLVKNSSVLQKQLLQKAISLTKKGGEIVYSTCSILKQENEEVIKPFLEKKLVRLEIINNIWNLPLLPSTINGVLTIKPTEEYEGFFVAKLVKL